MHATGSKNTALAEHTLPVCEDLAEAILRSLVVDHISHSGITTRESAAVFMLIELP